jgi:hypothetical protein
MIDLPPWIQTVALAVGLALVIAHEVGRAMLRRDPTSIWGARLVLLGPGLRALRRHPAAVALPPPVRAMLASLSDSEPPSDPDRTPVGGKGRP